jgi:hypothetical protein
VNRSTINARGLVLDQTGSHELFQVVRDISSEIIAARAQFADAELLIANAVKHERLNRRDISAATRPAPEVNEWKIPTKSKHGSRRRRRLVSREYVNLSEDEHRSNSNRCTHGCL